MNKTKTNTDINFGQRVEMLIREKEVKPTDFYKAVEIVPQSLYDWRNKGSVPNALIALRVARFFGVTIEYLLTGETDNSLQAKNDELWEKINKIKAFVSEA